MLLNVTCSMCSHLYVVKSEVQSSMKMPCAASWHSYQLASWLARAS